MNPGPSHVLPSPSQVPSEPCHPHPLREPRPVACASCSRCVQTTPKSRPLETTISLVCRAGVNTAEADSVLGAPRRLKPPLERGKDRRGSRADPWSHMRACALPRPAAGRAHRACWPHTPARGLPRRPPQPPHSTAAGSPQQVSPGSQAEDALPFATWPQETRGVPSAVLTRLLSFTGRNTG